MLDTAIGPILRVIDANSFVMQVTHIGNHNKYSYKNYETVYIAPNLNSTGTRLSNSLVGRRVRCSIRYRDNYSRLFADVEFDQS